MYGDHQFLSHFLLILKPATIYGSLPFRWNATTRQIEYAFPSQFQRRVYHLKCNLHVALTLVIIAQVILTNTQNPGMKAMCTFTVAMLTLTTVVVKQYSYQEQDATSLLAKFMQSSRESHEPMDAYERKRKIAIDLLNPGTFMFPLLYTFGVAWVFPCIPSNFGFWIVPKCSTYNWPFDEYWIFRLVRKGIFAGINFWIWSFGMHSTVVVGSGIVMVGSMHLRWKLKLYHKKIVQVKTDHNKEAWKAILIYRQIQFLCRHYNVLHQQFVMVAIIIAVVFTQSICIYALVEFHEDMQWILQLFFVMMGVDCFMAIVMLCGTLADTYDLSVQILDEVKKQHQGRGCKWLMRFHRSCQAIKMRFGLTNFMDKLTPLNFENFSLCQAVNFLLVKE